MADFAKRQAPEGTNSTTWNDAEGAHEVQIGASSIFAPKTAAEEAHAVNLGWPLVDGPMDDEPAKPKRSRTKNKPQPAEPTPIAVPAPAPIESATPDTGDAGKETD